MVLFYCKTSLAFSNFAPCVKNLTWYNKVVKLLTTVTYSYEKDKHFYKIFH